MSWLFVLSSCSSSMCFIFIQGCLFACLFTLTYNVPVQADVLVFLLLLWGLAVIGVHGACPWCLCGLLKSARVLPGVANYPGLHCPGAHPVWEASFNLIMEVQCKHWYESMIVRYLPSFEFACSPLVQEACCLGWVSGLFDLFLMNLLLQSRKVRCWP